MFTKKDKNKAPAGGQLVRIMETMPYIIQNVQGILSDKMAVEEEIDTVISASRTEQNIMLIMPLFIVAIIKFSDSDFAANFASPSGIISTIIAVVMFIAAYFIGKKMLSIKV